jgi:hypothetical protein
MKIPAKYRPIKNSIIAFVLFGFGLPWMIMAIDFSWSIGRPSEGFTDFMDTASIIANWPSLLLGLDKWESTLSFPATYLANAIGWGLIGLFVGMLVVALNSRKGVRE